MTSIKSDYISDIKEKTGGIVRAAKNNFGPWRGVDKNLYALNKKD
jgi:hypothetical protein